ncbi:MAG TPA: L-type lectin-domain containing protein [Polyangiaceae bacterium]
MSNRPLFRHVPAVAIVALAVAACAVTDPAGEPVATTSSALGNDIQYCNFSSVAGLQLNGNAAQAGTTLRLSTNTANQDSSAFRTTTLALAATTNFHTHFEFTLTPAGSQADGVTFVVQSDSRGDKAIGGNGGGIGYGASNGGTQIKPSVIVEFDVYQNTWDPNANHVGVMTGGDETTHVAVATPAFQLASNVPIDAWIDYTAATTTLQVFVSNTGATKPATALLTTTAVNVFSTVGAGAYFGLTGSTGGSFEAQVFDSWILSLQGLSECTCTTDAQCGGTTPRCEAPPGTCVQCLTNTDCGGLTPVCSLTTHTCGACTANAQCGGTTPYCAPAGDPLAGECVACVTTAECDASTTTATPICNKAGTGIDTCRACATSAECVAATLEPICLTTGAHVGECAQCATNANCSGSTPICVDTGATDQCEQCGTSADCSGKTPVCTAVHVCGPCGSDADCKAPTPACQTSGSLQGECTQCSATNKSQCTGADPACNTTTGTCTGCDVDADCAKGNWCDENVHTCTATLANGVAVPNDPPHTSPTLNGTCTADAGTLVCQSGVCDTKDNECGYANGDGPCTAGNGALVCRSGTCSLGGVCEPPGACASDADCTGGNWCDESTATCTPKLANGTSIPVDAPHMSPILDGECTLAAAALVCVSGVCDIKDNRCGYANGDGPCTSSTAGAVCRSAACSTNGTCEPMGGCNVDGDCPGGTCNTTTHLCQAVAMEAGTPDSGAGEDSGTPDSGSGADAGTQDSGSGADASMPVDGSAGSDTGADAGGVSPGADGGATAEDASSGSGAYLDGGGLSCGVASRPGGASSSAAMVVGLGLLAATRRRRSKRSTATVA